MAIEKMDLQISEIDKLKQHLADSDYKIVKQSEAQLVGASLPYALKEMQEIYAERQIIRNRIKELE